MLELKGISKSFGGVTAVQDVSMTLRYGEVRGLIGPNGAGKSTLINLISGLLSPTSGALFLDGEPLTELASDTRARKGIARTFQNLRLFQSLTVAENIQVAQYARGGGELLQAAIERFQLTEKLNWRASTLSYGDQRRLEIVRGLAMRPKVLMLDEPAAGMNEDETDELGRALSWVQYQTGCAMMIIDHDLKFIMTLCDEITVLDMGAVISEGKPHDVAQNPDVIAAYLGEET